MIVDAHYHLEDRLETVDRLLGQMDRHGISRIALIPAMQDPFYLGRIAGKAGGLMRWVLMGKWRSVGLFLYRTMVTADGKFRLLNKTYMIYDTPDNESVSRVMQAHPDRFYGWIFVNPRVTDSMAIVEKWVGQPGWIGVKAHPFWHRYPVAVLNDVAAYCSDKDLPILVHLGGDRERGDYRYLPEHYPRLKVVYAHAGVPFYRELWDYAKSKNNIFVDLSSPYLNEPLRFTAVKALGAEKCLYGTDGPIGYTDINGSYDHGKILNEILQWPLSDADKEQITGGNFREITST